MSEPNKVSVEITGICIRAEGRENVQAALAAIPMLVGMAMGLPALAQPEPPKRGRKKTPAKITIDPKPQQVKDAQ